MLTAKHWSEVELVNGIPEDLILCGAEDKYSGLFDAYHHAIGRVDRASGVHRPQV